jgi:hypothetical protein
MFSAAGPGVELQNADEIGFFASAPNRSTNGTPRSFATAATAAL